MSLQQIHHQTDADISHLEFYVLHEQTEALTKVVFLNWPGLDLVFISQGGICMKLGEYSCFYANKQGVISEILQKVGDNLDK